MPRPESNYIDLGHYIDLGRAEAPRRPTPVCPETHHHPHFVSHNDPRWSPRTAAATRNPWHEQLPLAYRSDGRGYVYLPLGAARCATHVACVTTVRPWWTCMRCNRRFRHQAAARAHCLDQSELPASLDGEDEADPMPW